MPLYVAMMLSMSPALNGSGDVDPDGLVSRLTAPLLPVDVSVHMIVQDSLRGFDVGALTVKVTW